KLLQDARFFLTPNLFITYGTTETGRVARTDAAVALADPTAVGYLTPWLETEIVDEADRPVPAGQEGRVRVRGAQVITSYYRAEVATRRSFRDGWFHPGDIGVLAESGLLRLTGRIEDVIVRDGA